MCTTSTLNIIDTPISFSPDRVEATKAYLRQHSGRHFENITMVPRVIVLHWTSIPTFERSFSVFNKETLNSNRTDIAAAGNVNVAVHFLVDRDGSVHRLMPETRIGRHCIGLNHCAIGIENVGGANGTDDLTEAQLRANIKLIRYLHHNFQNINYLIGHHEYRVFEGHPLWGELDENYRTEKIDPGAAFMGRVRRAVRDLHLKGVNEIRMEIEKHAKNQQPNLINS